jgi:multimeric flavodoxin WrbA
MNLLALISSNRRNGNTARLVRMIETQARALAERHGAPLEFETLFLGDLDMRQCRGCRACFDRGEDRCPLKDDMAGLRARLDAADGFILASPVYVNDVNGVAKTFIDRLAYVCHRPALAGKCAYLIATVADSPTGHALQTMNIALRTWGCHIVGQAGYRLGPLLPQDELVSRYQAEAARVAAALFDAVAQQRYLRPGFLSLMMFKIQQLAWQREPPGSLDSDYWHSQGWLDPGRTFFIAHRANPAKVALARLVGGVVSRFVT